MSAGEPGVLILADDLTGACDAGVAFAARGLATHVELRDRPPAPLERGAVVSIDLASRMADRDAIHRRVAEALGGAGLRAADELLLKIDSTLRGPIGAHIDAVFAMAGDRVAFVAAAVPSHGRTTVAGIQLVHGVAVDSTEAARDPHVPVGSSAIAAAVGELSAQIGLATIRAGDSILRRAVDAALARRRIVIFDATEDADLAAVVRVQTAFPQAFWVGAAGIAAQLAARRPRGATIDTGGLGRGPIAFVVGSPSAVAQAQVRALAADGVATEWI
ncbi:MAG: four-carbon acid sugar kinase family protein, partial [Candidatus Dormibacteria bacterium]